MSSSRNQAGRGSSPIRSALLVTATALAVSAPVLTGSAPAKETTAAPAPQAVPAPPTLPGTPTPGRTNGTLGQQHAATAPFVQGGNEIRPVAAVTSGTALNRALSKVGAPYRWGAAGPNAFDCSGLVTWAYQGSGVPLPRSSRAMSQVGTPVGKAQLRPGDLVFFYRPVSHVGIYLGNGKIVHASSRKSPVKVSDMSRMKFTTARRV